MQIDAKDGRQREIGERKHRAPLPRSFSLSLSVSVSRELSATCDPNLTSPVIISLGLLRLVIDHHRCIGTMHVTFRKL